MFTGLIEELGTVVNIINRGKEASGLKIKAVAVLEDAAVGDSIAVNGICLTVASLEKSSFVADVMPETLRRTNLERLRAGEKVNLERALPAAGRFGGHIVTGHIDGVGRIVQRLQEGNAVVFKIMAPAEILKLTIEKGSMAVDGISLTVVRAEKESFTVSLIPHTASMTTLGFKSAGDIVNLEGDIIGKYIEKIMRVAPSSTITFDTLQKNGFL